MKKWEWFLHLDVKLSNCPNEGSWAGPAIIRMNILVYIPPNHCPVGKMGCTSVVRNCLGDSEYPLNNMRVEKRKI
jgi:hypothetical protein